MTYGKRQWLYYCQRNSSRSQGNNVGVLPAYPYTLLHNLIVKMMFLHLLHWGHDVHTPLLVYSSSICESPFLSESQLPQVGLLTVCSTGIGSILCVVQNCLYLSFFLH